MNRLVIVCLTLLAVAVLVTPAPADGCVRSRAVCFSAPVVVTPVYTAPVVTTQTYHAQVYAQAIPVYSQAYIFSALNEGVIADAAAFRAYSLMLQQFQGNGGGLNLNQQQPGINPQRKLMPPADPQARGNGGNGGNVVKTAVDPKLQTVVTASCVQCHSGAVTKGGLDLSDLSTVSEFHRLKSVAKVNRGDMPKFANPLPDEEVRLFDEWSKSAEVVKK